MARPSFTDLFLSVVETPGALLTLIDAVAPGAIDALFKFGKDAGISIVTRSHTPPGAPTAYISRLSCPNGAAIAVHHNAKG